MFEPTMFPIAISDSPLRAAIILVTNSGRLVPNATMVNPITRSEMPTACAMSMAARTVILLPNINAINPSKINNVIFVGPSCLVSVFVSVLPREITNKYPKNTKNNPNKQHIFYFLYWCILNPSA